MENEEKNQTEQSDKSRSVWRELWDYAKIIIAVFVIAFLLGHFVYINARVPSGSMEETIMTGDRVFGNRLAYIKDDPERFDIVIFKYPDDPSQLFVKRVIGLPGETVNIVDGKVYINDSEEPLDDSFCPETPEGSFGPYTVPEGCYFMLGDNRNHSMDSRYWQNPFVEEDAIEAEVAVRYWPLNKIGTLRYAGLHRITAGWLQVVWKFYKRLLKSGKSHISVLILTVFCCLWIFQMLYCKTEGK